MEGAALLGIIVSSSSELLSSDFSISTTIGTAVCAD